MNTLLVSPISAFEDNYIWLLEKPGNPACALVDPGDEEPVLAVLQERGLALESILLTHKHGDHTGGVHALRSAYPNVRIYGPAHEPVFADEKLTEGDQIFVLGERFTVWELPGHTEGHLAYLGDGRAFCGDVLFAGGCGRVFSGTFEQMSRSLQRLAQLPPETQVYCAHEYTVANLGFALWVEPENEAIESRLAEEKAKRQAGQPTVPSTLAQELATNPFLRTEQPAVIAAAQRWAGQPLDAPHAVFAALRQWKDRDYD